MEVAMEKTVCELFAGVGGFRLELERASSEQKTVWFSQYEPSMKKQQAHECQVKHFGDVDEFTGIDIAAVDKNHIPEHNLLVGGFPCQDYSVARPLTGSTGLEGKKGVLWWQIRDVLAAKHTPFVLLENVDRLLKSPATQRGRDFGVMLACLAELGYLVEWRVINAAEYGAAQRRRRTFIFAAHSSTSYVQDRIYFDEETRLTKEGFFARSFPVMSCEKIKQVDIDYTDIPAVSDKFQFQFKNAGFMYEGSVYTADVKPVLEPPITMREILQEDVPETYYLNGNHDKWAYLKGAKKIERVSKTGHSYVFSEGAIAFPDSLDSPARTMLTSESSLNRSTHVIEDPQTHRLRLLTPVEAERIQGFDDGWTDTGMSHRFRYFCMGNALVVPMVTRMGIELNKIFAQEK